MIRTLFMIAVAIVLMMPANLLSKPLDIDSVAQSFIDSGYLDCKITISGDSLSIEKGKRYNIDKLIILPSDTIVLRKQIPFTKEAIHQKIQALLQDKIGEGYIYQTYIPKEIVKEDSTVSIVFAQNKGPRPQISQVRFEGLQQTNESQLKKYLMIEDSSFITQDNLKSIEKDVTDIPYIAYVPPPYVEILPGYTEADIILNAREKRLFALEGSIGYLSEVDEVIWMGDLTLQNLFGNGRKIDVFSQKVNSNNQNLSIHFWQPSFLLGVGGIDFSVSTRDYRNQFYEFNLKTEALYKIHRSLKLGGGLHYKSVEPEGSNSFSVYAASFKANYSNRAKHYLSDNEYSVGWELTYSARRNNTSDSVQASGIAYDDTRIHLDLSYKLPLFFQTSIYNKFQYYGFETSDDLPPLSELYLIGGERTIRGFRDEQFTAIRSILTTTEYHIAFNSGYLFSFLDAAYLYNRIYENETVVDDEYYRFGYGFGMQIQNNGREFKISFGWNKDLAFDQPRLSVQFQTGL